MRAKRRYVVAALLAVLLMVTILTPASEAATAEQFAVFGISRVTLDRTSRITGDLGSDGTIAIGRNSRISGDVFGDTINIDREVSVEGDVHFNTLNTEQDVSVQGNQITPLPLPVIGSLPFSPAFTPGTVDVIEDRGAHVTLEPGSYNDIAIDRNSTITVTGGTYHVRRLTIGRNADVVFLAPATLYISESFTLDREGRYHTAPGLEASGVVFHYAGNGTVAVGRGSILTANILAPLGTIRIERDAEITGALAGREVEIERGVVLTQANTTGEDGLPPDPGEAGKATLEGIDSDGDGIRDDIQRYIALNFPDDEKMRQALRRFTEARQRSLLVAEDKDASIAQAHETRKVFDCVYFVHEDVDEAGRIMMTLRAEILNTEARSNAYVKYNDQLAGEVFSLTPDDQLSIICQ